MLIISKTNEIPNSEVIPDEVRADIFQAVYILDSAYGSEREPFKDLGGFCCVVDSLNDVDKLLAEWKIDIKEDISEYSVKIDGYIKKLFILSSDYAIVTYIKSNLLD